MREFGDGVTRALVDGAGDFPALDMHDADVHVRRGDGGGERLVAVSDEQHEIRRQALEFTGELDYAETDGLGHRRGGGAFELDINFAVDAEPIAAHDLDGPAEAPEHHGARGDHLHFDFGMIVDGAHHRLQASVVCAIDEHDTDFSAWHVDFGDS